MNKGNVVDTEMENIMDITVDGLFSVFATLGANHNFNFRNIYVLRNKKKELADFFRCGSCYSQP